MKENNILNSNKKVSSEIEKLNTEFLEGEEYVGETEADMEDDLKTGSRFHFPALLRVSAAPHVKSPVTTSSIMLDVFLALLPAFIWGVFVFGLRALIIGLISVSSAVLFEFLYQKLMGRENTVGDLSAAVTGLLLAMNLSSAVPYWMPVVGAFFAIVVVKGIFGGLGKNIVNPALAARVFLFAWPAEMNTFGLPGVRAGIISKSADIVASATPLTQIKTEGVLDASVFDLVIGNVGGCIGEVSALLLIAGGVYLLCRRVITWQIPVAYIGTVALFALIFPRIGTPVESLAIEVFSGGLILGSIFMATDYVTSPVTATGKLIFGVGCGLITVLIRRFGGYSEGVSFSILVMNLLVWYIDKLTMPKPFGSKGGKVNGKKE